MTFHALTYSPASASWDPVPGTEAPTRLAALHLARQPSSPSGFIRRGPFLIEAKS